MYRTLLYIRSVRATKTLRAIGGWENEGEEKNIKKKENNCLLSAKIKSFTRNTIYRNYTLANYVLYTYMYL